MSRGSLTQEQSSSITGIRRAYLSQIEKGGDFRLSPIQMRMLMEVYGVDSLDDLIEITQGEQGTKEVEARTQMLDVLRAQKKEST